MATFVVVTFFTGISACTVSAVTSNFEDELLGKAVRQKSKADNLQSEAFVGLSIVMIGLQGFGQNKIRK